MKYFKTITLKDGRKCILRNGEEKDGQAALANFILTHEQTDYLLSYPDENTMTAEQEGRFLQEKTDSDNGVELLAEIDGVVAGLAGLDAVWGREKIRHRADFGISVDRQYWNLGIGTALMNACIECARAAGYEQIEVRPRPGRLSSASGTVHTPHGDVFVAWEKNGAGLKLEVSCDAEMKRRIKSKIETKTAK